MHDQLDAEAGARVGRALDDKWTLEKLLGIGGMGAVYLGRHRNGARAAVKVLHAAFARNPDVRERFLREGYAANKVEHRGAVQVLDDDIVRDGPDDGAAYLVMELLEGESLEDRAERDPSFGEREFLVVADGVLEVLEAAHERGVIHRDLKPDNVFLARESEDGRVRVKVLDFGLARLAEHERTTQFGLALGTPSYMSPEQASGRNDEIDGRTDLFALAATGFRLLAKRRIHEEENAVALVLKMSSEPAPPIRSVAPAISEAVAAIIDRALAFRREDRYPTATAMRAEVQAALSAMPGEPLNAPAAAGGQKAARGGLDLPPPSARAAPAPEPTMMLSENDLLTSSEESVATAPLAPREAEPAAPLEPPPPAPPPAPPATARRTRPAFEPSASESTSGQLQPAMYPRPSAIPIVTVLFWATLFFADRCSSEKATEPAREAQSPAPSSLAAASAPINDRPLELLGSKPSAIPDAHEEALAADTGALGRVLDASSAEAHHEGADAAEGTARAGELARHEVDAGGGEPPAHDAGVVTGPPEAAPHPRPVAAPAPVPAPMPTPIPIPIPMPVPLPALVPPRGPTAAPAPTRAPAPAPVRKPAAPAPAPTRKPR